MQEPQEVRPFQKIKQTEPSRPAPSTPPAEPLGEAVEVTPVKFISRDPDADENLYDFRPKVQEADDPKDSIAAELASFSDLSPEI